MAEMLARLPPEVFGLVIEKLRKADLKALSRVSKYVHAVVSKALWRSVTIEPWSEYHLHRIAVAALPQARLQLATQLHFRSDVLYSTKERCPHVRDDENPWNTDDEDEFEAKYEDEDEYKDWPRFDRLTQKAKTVLGKLENGQLQSFSWDLGTCVPSGILGSHGIIPLKQPFLRSISLTTDSSCSHFYNSDCEIDLSSFRHLQSLRWRAPNPDNLNALSVAIERNSVHLRKLELDFVNWPKLWDSIGYDSDEKEDDDGNAEQYYFAGEVLRLNRRSPRPLFPAIRELSLSQVPLAAAVARAINFDTLVSLTLRMCPAWDEFIGRVVQLNLPIKLRTLEIQESDKVSRSMGEDALSDFLDAFEGLEELFISHSGPAGSLELWNHVVRHHATLRRLVHHQRTVNIDYESPYFEEEFDLPDLEITGRDMRQIREDPSKNPLARLNLECIGLACIPERLKYVLLPFTSKASLKVLHIRQSGSDLDHYASWAVDSHPSRAASPARREIPSDSEESYPCTDSGITSPTSETEEVAPGPDEEDATAGGNEAGFGRRLRDEFRRFVEWVFGPQGLASLQIVAFGDFAYGGRAAQNNLLFCRSTDGRSNFRLLSESGTEWEEVLDEYRNALEACPVEPLLKD